MYIMNKTKGKNTMNTFFSITAILSAILAVGSIEDCGGHCLGQENWTMFFVMMAIMIGSVVGTILTLDKEDY